MAKGFKSGGHSLKRVPLPTDTTTSVVDISGYELKVLSDNVNSATESTTSVVDISRRFYPDDGDLDWAHYFNKHLDNLRRLCKPSDTSAFCKHELGWWLNYQGTEPLAETAFSADSEEGN